MNKTPNSERISMNRLAQRIAHVLSAAPAFVSDEGSRNQLEIAASSVDDLAAIGIEHIQPAAIPGEAPADGIALAKQINELRLDLFEVDAKNALYGSEFDTALGNLAYLLCMEGGCDLEGDSGYCLKANDDEICRWNLLRIAEHQAQPG